MTRPCNQLRHERVTDCYAGSAQHTIVNKAQSLSVIARALHYAYELNSLFGTYL